jgi:hypothetical protein
VNLKQQLLSLFLTSSDPATLQQHQIVLKGNGEDGRGCTLGREIREPPFGVPLGCSSSLLT